MPPYKQIATPLEQLFSNMHWKFQVDRAIKYWEIDFLLSALLEKISFEKNSFKDFGMSY